MKVVLLTRFSPFQVYCMNALYEKGILTGTVLEQGSSYASESQERKVGAINVRRMIRLASDPAKTLCKIQNLVLYKKYYGNQKYHNSRVFQNNYETINPNLPVFNFSNVNDEECINWIRSYKPGLVYVFGTGLIHKPLIEAANSPIVNMHWGWSPDYRAEGIVSALASGGSKHLGVTVHLLDTSIDGGDILYRERPQIDKEDNFYSIGMKITRIGTELFIRVFHEFERSGALSGIKQDLSKGNLYSGKYMSQHPELYLRAWKNLRAEQRRL